MPFVFDFTIGGAGSTSYVPLVTYTILAGSKTIVGADDYFLLHPKASLWSALTTTEKQQFLVRATSRLDVETYGGRQAVSTQRLQWPRTWVIDRNFEQDQDFLEFASGNYFQSDDFHPLELEYATFEQALHYIEEFREETELVSRRDQERMESFTIGPLTVKTRKTTEDVLPAPVVRWLSAIGPNGWQGGRMPKLVRT